MKHTIELITNELCKMIQSLFPHQSQILNKNAASASTSTTWYSHRNNGNNDSNVPMIKMMKIKTFVLRSKSILNSYLDMIGRLTKIDFTLRDKDPWKGEFEKHHHHQQRQQRLGGYHHEKADELIHRIDTVYSTYAIHDEILSVLPSQDQKDFERLNLLEVRLADSLPFLLRMLL
jgi:hypothetical protein